MFVQLIVFFVSSLYSSYVLEMKLKKMAKEKNHFVLGYTQGETS
jgi:hypothetical protein